MKNNELIDRLRSESACISAASFDRSDEYAKVFDMAAHAIHELERTRSEAEAAARVAGYQEGQRDLRQSIRALIGGI